MRLSPLLFTVWAAVSAAANGLSEMPKCGLSCMVSIASNSTCGLTNTQCLCSSAPLIADIQECVLLSCSPKEALTTKNITATNCGIHPRDKTGTYNTVSNVFGTISGVFVATRLGYKAFVSRQEFGLDDLFILATLITGIPSSIINAYALTKYGLARDIWTLPFNHITQFGRYFYIMEVLYFSQVFLLKLSILFFYLRIFPGNGVRKLLWGCVGFDLCYGVAFVAAAIFQCQPISYFWTKWSGETTGTCMSINHMAWANAALSIIMDIAMLAIPLSQLRELKLHWKKKLGVALMFCIGTFVTIISIVRLRSLVEFANSHNPTWDQWEASLWSTIEINVGIICACMPALRVILVRFFPRVFGGTSYNRSTGAGYYASNSHKYVRSHTRSGNHGMPASGSSVVRSVARGGADANEPSVPADKSAIVFSRSFTVNYAEGDEMALVAMSDVDRVSAAESFEMKAAPPAQMRRP
ncbi:hypothetical protein TD95_001251 [Thielaviopsis punctulata]|uniref:CFEM domain-containing protein n=1 Tax=Thielaviopsis punctulata TaxID=72032 RepID=A0A0F4ZCU9_9PEZI|nr:hypothetical protein TD95_001251 [Thielaviopsis punctulata]